MRNILLLLLIPAIALSAGRLQDSDFKTEAELTGAGGTAAQLLNDTKIYITGNSINKTLDDAITDGDIGGKLTTKGNLFGFSTVTQECVLDKTDGKLLTVDSTAICGFDFKDPPSVSPTVNEGDMIVRGPTEDIAVPLGTENQVLTAGGLNNVIWADIPLQTPTTTEGDLILRGATEDARLPIGGTGQLLTSNGTTAEWADAPISTTLDTKGQIQTYDTANASLNVGANGTFLVADSAEATGLKWTDAISGTLNPVTDWVDGTCGTNFTTNTTVLCKYKRVGDEAIVNFRINFTGTPTPTATSLGVSLPSEITGAPDSSKFLYAGAVAAGLFFDASSGRVPLVQAEYSAGYIYPRILRPNTTDVHYSYSITDTSPNTIVNGDFAEFTFRIPIQGWSSGTDAAITNKKIRSVMAFKTITQTLTHNTTTPIVFDLEEEDDYNLYNNTTGVFTCPSDAVKFKVSYSVYLENLIVTGSNNTRLLQAIRSDGLTVTMARDGGDSTVAWSRTASMDIDCSSGLTWTFDALCFESDASNCSTRANIGDIYFNQLSISERVDNAVIAGTFENINSTDLLKVRANSLTGSTDSTSFAYNFVNTITEAEDNYNALTDTGDIVFTVPANKAGYYNFDFGFAIDLSAGLTGAVWECGLDIASALSNDRSHLALQQTGQLTYYPKCIFENIKLADGDTVKFFFRKEGTATISWLTDTRHNYLEITELPDYEAIVKNLYDNTTKCQLKTMGADATTTGVISALTFTGLTIGKRYKFNSYFKERATAAGRTTIVIEPEDSTGTAIMAQLRLGNYYTVINQDSWSTFAPKTFTATNDTLRFDLAALVHANILSGSYVELCELPDSYVETTEW